MSFHKLNPKKNIMKQFISWYSTKLQTHPMTTKAITSGIIAGAGDLTCQYIIQRQMFYNSIEHEAHHGDISIASIQQNLDQSNQLHYNQHLHNAEWGETKSSSFFIFQPDLIRTSRFTFLGFALIAPVVHVSTLILTRMLLFYFSPNIYFDYFFFLPPGTKY
jgi:hypothetical protein